MALGEYLHQRGRELCRQGGFCLTQRRRDAEDGTKDGGNAGRREPGISAPALFVRSFVLEFPPSLLCVPASLRESVFGFIFGFYATYTRPDASFIEQGTAATVLVASHPVFGVPRCFLGLRPKPRHSSLYANGGRSFKFEVSGVKREEPKVRTSHSAAGRSCETKPIRHRPGAR